MQKMDAFNSSCVELSVMIYLKYLFFSILIYRKRRRLSIEVKKIEFSFGNSSKIGSLFYFNIFLTVKLNIILSYADRWL